MTETLPSTLPASLRGSMHELTHHYPANLIADAAMHLLPEETRAQTATCYLGRNIEDAVKVLVRRYSTTGVAVATLDTLDTDILVEVLTSALAKLSPANVKKMIHDSGVFDHERNTIRAVTEDGEPIIAALGDGKLDEYIQTRKIASPHDVVRKFHRLHYATEYIEGGPVRRLAVYREVTEEQSGGE